MKRPVSRKQRQTENSSPVSPLRLQIGSMFPWSVHVVLISFNFHLILPNKHQVFIFAFLSYLLNFCNKQKLYTLTPTLSVCGQLKVVLQSIKVLTSCSFAFSVWTLHNYSLPFSIQVHQPINESSLTVMKQILLREVLWLINKVSKL